MRFAEAEEGDLADERWTEDDLDDGESFGPYGSPVEGADILAYLARAHRPEVVRHDTEARLRVLRADVDALVLQEYWAARIQGHRPPQPVRLRPA